MNFQKRRGTVKLSLKLKSRQGKANADPSYNQNTDSNYAQLYNIIIRVNFADLKSSFRVVGDERKCCKSVVVNDSYMVLMVGQIVSKFGIIFFNDTDS